MARRPDGGCPNAACGYDYEERELIGPKYHWDPYMERDVMYKWCPKCGQRLVFYLRKKRVMVTKTVRLAS